MKVGIIGMPNAGKSSLFNALTRAGAQAANYPFTTIEPNVAVVPVADDPAIERRPLLDFTAGYVLRSMDTFPRQGSSGPWTIAMDYWTDYDRLRKGPVEDAALRFGTADRVPARTGAAAR